MRKKLMSLIVMLVLLCIGCSQQEEQEAISQTVTIIAPSAVGEGWDKTARAIKDIFIHNKFIDEDIRILNKIGAGGELGWKYTKQQKDHVLAMNSSLLITNYLLGQSKLTYKDFTPIATLATEWEVVIVAKDSNIKSAKSLMKNLKVKPQQYKIGVSPRLGNDDQISFILASKQAGIDPKELDFLVYENSSQVVDALLKKQIDVASMTLSEAKKYYDLNQVQLLVISSEKRLKGLAEVPTWTEEGIALVFKHWRGIMGPPNMAKKEIEFWEKSFEKMVKTEEWKQTLQEYMWDDYYMNSNETARFLGDETKKYKLLIDIN